MSKRKPLAIRKPCGRISTRGTVELLPPTQIRRMVDAAASGMRDALWASQVGRLHLAAKLNASQLAAGKRWTELVANYAEASQAPCPPRTKPLDNAGGSAAERVVDSVCVQDRAPAGLHELDALRTGLQSLSTWWSARRKEGPR